MLQVQKFCNYYIIATKRMVTRLEKYCKIVAMYKYINDDSNFYYYYPHQISFGRRYYMAAVANGNHCVVVVHTCCTCYNHPAVK